MKQSRDRSMPDGTFVLELPFYRSLQKNYGKSVGLRAPGSFVEMLRRKAESAGGEVCEFSTYKT